MDKLRMQSSNGVEDNITKIAQLFPDCVTETVDERSGQPKHLIDFEKLKQNLSDSVMSERAERYQFTWPDKSKAILLANSPINATLRPCREESVDFDNTKNLYIEGDNLDVLKCLKETYLHKVKMIYIDPPYNTGNDFVYEDDFAQSSEEYLANSGLFDEQGNRMFTNAESNGRFHTDWLNMIYPRLKVARDLLTDDGVIFISIDDNEVENLRKVCDEVFGEQNFVDCLHWKKKKQPSFLAKHTAKVMEYVIVYAKNTFKLEKLSVEKVSDSNKKVININNKVSSRIFKPGVRVKSEEQTGIIKAGVYTGRSMDVEYKNDIYYENGRTTNEVEVVSKFSDSQSNIDTFIQKDLLYITKNFLLRRDVGEEAVEKRKSITDLLLNDYGDNQESDKEFLELFDKKYFDYTKPIKLIYNLVKSNFTEEGIILDFFSGSATTAHAVMQLNSEDGGNRKFIMVQLPEKTDEKSEAFKAGYKNICEIGKERIRRAGKKIKEESPLTTQDLDTGFRVLKLDSTNMQDIYYSPKDISQPDLFSQVDNVKPDRTGEDLLFQVMLELGATLDSKIETAMVAGKTLYDVAEGYLVACFDQNVSDEVVKAIAQMQPAYAVLRDTSMTNDATVTNFEQIFKTISPDTVTRIL